ncbi:MAG: efflux RND transporter periplasmic adaptor subunit [Saprospiraceae bacterium]
MGSFIRKNWIWLLAALFVILTALAIWKSKQKPKGTEVSIEKVQRRNISEKVTASGKIFPEKEVKISSDVSGQVVELYVKEGDSVKTGQILARVNPDAYQSALERSRAGVNTAISRASSSKVAIQGATAQRDQIGVQFDNAQKTLERTKQMYKDGIVSRAELDNAETQARNLAASLQASEANLESSRNNYSASNYQIRDAQAMLKETNTNFERTIIKAPASGVISKLNIERGERVVGTIQMTGTEIMRIADLNAMEVQVEVSENDIVRVSIGDPSVIEVDAYPGKKFTGQVTEISNSASKINFGTAASLSTDQVTKFLVKVRINKESYSDLMSTNNSMPFRPGMSATVEIRTDNREQVLAVPIQCVIAYDAKAEINKKKKEIKEDQKNNAVQKEEKLVLDQNDFREAVFVRINDTVSRVDVKTGIQDENYIEITNGLSEEMEVVTGPYSAISKDLKSGSRVRLKKDKEEKKK